MQTDDALVLMAEARKIAQEHGFNMTVAIVDAGGHPVALARGKNWHGPYIAFGKARLSAAFRKPSAVLVERWKDRQLFAQSLTEVLPQGVTLNPGGYPIWDGDTCIGAIGIGGSTPANDDMIARLSVEAYARMMGRAVAPEVVED